jgi:dipeptidyl aminopeptidase/acylaminoacyl peptidase
MGGGIAARVMVLRPEIRAIVLFAPISADAEDNFYELSKEEVAWLHATYGLSGSETYKKISPLNYFSDVSAPVQLHHGTKDADVPLVFSERMFSMLTTLGKRAEFYVYPGEAHEFIAAWPVAAERALQFFDTYVKK